jgi:hypothetical protein
MRWMILPYIVAVAILAAAFPTLAQPLEGNPASDRTPIYRQGVMGEVAACTFTVRVLVLPHVSVPT